MTNNLHPNPISRTPDRKRRAVILVRVSGDAQDVARQEDEITDVIKEHNLEAIRTIALEGISGTEVLDKDQMQKLFADMSDPTVDGVACSALDRVWRPANGKQMRILDYFADNAKFIWTAREGELNPSTDAGWEQCMTLATRAGAELREIRRRSISGKTKNAKRNQRNSGSHPYGYRHEHIIDDRKRQRTILVIHEKEAEVVRQIFAWALSKLGVMAIAKKLNMAGIPSPHAGRINNKTKLPNSGRWDQKTIYQILTNRIYTGTYLYPANSPTAVRCHCPAIIEDGVWQAVNMQFAGNKETMRGPSITVRKYTLTGLLWCLECGHRMTTFPKPRMTAHYRCGYIDRRPPMRQLCDARGYRQDVLEPLVFDTVWEHFSDTDRLHRIITAAFEDNEPQPAGPDLQTLRKEVELKRGIENRAYENMRDPELPRERAKREWQLAKQARLEAENQLSEAETPRQVAPTREHVEALAKQLVKAKPETFEEKRAWLRSIIREIRVGEDQVHKVHKVHIECFLPETLLPAEGEDLAKKFSGGAVLPDQKTGSLSLRPPLKQPISFTINTVVE